MSEVTLVAGDAETLPTQVRITELTVLEGDDIAAGAEVTVVGNYNEETGVIEASQIVAVMPQLKITARVTAVTSDREIEVSDITVVMGKVDVSAFSGKVIITEATGLEGGELAVGATVTITGTLDETTGDVIADQVVVTEIVLLAVISSSLVNSEFQIAEISVQDGDIDPSTLTGTVRLGPDVEVEGGEVTPGLQVTVTGSVEGDTGVFLATRVVVIVAERILILEMEDNRGRRKELIIKFQ